MIEQVRSTKKIKSFIGDLREDGRITEACYMKTLQIAPKIAKATSEAFHLTTEKGLFIELDFETENDLEILDFSVIPKVVKCSKIRYLNKSGSPYEASSIHIDGIAKEAQVISRTQRRVVFPGRREANY